MIEEKEILIGEINNDVIHVYPELQEKATTPTTQEQIITPDENIYGLSKVTIGAIPSEYVIPSGTLNINDVGTYDVKNYESANVTSPNKWADVGYDAEPKSIDIMHDVTKNIYDNWNSTVTDMSQMFENNRNITIFPLVNTSKVRYTYRTFYGCTSLQEVPLLDMQKCQSMNDMFNGCSSLTTIPLFDVPRVYNVSNMFSFCYRLSDESLDNILKMCINLVSYTGTKKLSNLGISGYDTSRIQALPSYQAFISAGWTIN